MPGAVDSNIPMTWDLVDGGWRLFALASWGGIPVRMSGSSMDQMRQEGPVAIGPHPGYGIWIESIIPDEAGTWYGYYHHEIPAFVCQRTDRAVPRVGSARSFDRGLTWEDLGVVLEAAAENIACGSSNRFVVGGLGDVSVMRAPGGTDLFLFFSQYSKLPSEQGVVVARLAWADRDAPGGRAMTWQTVRGFPRRASPALTKAARHGVTRLARRSSRCPAPGMTATPRRTPSGDHQCIGTSTSSAT